MEKFAMANPAKKSVWTPQDYQLIFMGAFEALGITNLSMAKSLAEECETLEQALHACKAMKYALVNDALEPFPGAIHRAFDSVRHEKVREGDTIPCSYEGCASELATAYSMGQNRMGVARQCEEQGILAALVLTTLPDRLRTQFLADMKAIAGETEPEESEEG